VRIVAGNSLLQQDRYVVFAEGVVGAGRASFAATVAQGQEGMMAKTWQPIPAGTAIGRGAEDQAGASAGENRIQARPAKD
jgi:hypothetical protein